MVHCVVVTNKLLQDYSRPLCIILL